MDLDSQTGHIHQHDNAASRSPSKVLRLMSYNIQVGMTTSRFRDYITGSWRHVLPHSGAIKNLNTIASFVKDYDMVGLQEVDAGSMRSGFINQAEYLAHMAGFPYWHSQLNRPLGKFAQHSNGVLTKYRPYSIKDHKLPGLIPGRGAIKMKFGTPAQPLVLVMMHLALSQRTRDQQLSYIAKVIEGYEHVVLMGDLNCPIEGLCALADTQLRVIDQDLKTFPSWQPTKHLDHILVSKSLTVNHIEVLEHGVSDHLPIGVEIQLPKHFKF